MAPSKQYKLICQVILNLCLAYLYNEEIHIPWLADVKLCSVLKMLQLVNLNSDQAKQSILKPNRCNEVAVAHAMKWALPIFHIHKEWGPSIEIDSSNQPSFHIAFPWLKNLVCHRWERFQTTPVVFIWLYDSVTWWIFFYLNSLFS